MKRLLIIAGGEWQVPIIRKAKSMGIFVINSNLYLDSPGFEFADVGVVSDVLDKYKNLEVAKQYDVDAVLTDQSDIAVTTVAHVAKQLGLHGIGSEKAELFTNKYLMRMFCDRYSFPTPAFALCQDVNGVSNFAAKYGLPIVVKPPSNQSSRGVVKVTTRDYLVPAYNEALSQSHDGTVLVEEFVNGSELTIDGIKLNAGGHYCLATSYKSHYAHNEMVASQLVFSQTHPEIDFNALHQQHNNMIKAMSLPFGLTHAEYKYFKGKFYLIEIAARGGGTRLSSDIVPLMSGIDSNELLIRMALGEQISEISPIYCNKVAVLDFMEFSPGRIKSIDGLNEVASLSGVDAVGIHYKKGDIISPATDDRTRHGYVIAHADDMSELNILLAKIKEMVKISYE